MVDKTFYARDYLIGGNTADNSASTSLVVANRDGSILERLEDVTDNGERAIVTGAALLVNGTTVFTVAGGFIEILGLLSANVVDADAAAATIQWSADGTLGSAVTITGASASVASVAPGGIVNCDFTTLATAPVIAANGVALQGPTAATGGSVIIPAGALKLVIGGADTTASTWKHYMRYRPLGPGVSVTAAF
jgi:hypothetical protein